MPESSSSESQSGFSLQTAGSFGGKGSKISRRWGALGAPFYCRVSKSPDTHSLFLAYSLLCPTASAHRAWGEPRPCPFSLSLLFHTLLLPCTPLPFLLPSLPLLLPPSLSSSSLLESPCPSDSHLESAPGAAHQLWALLHPLHLDEKLQAGILRRLGDRASCSAGISGWAGQLSG